MNLLLFAVIQQVEVLWLQAAHIVALPVQHRDRSQHHVDAGADRFVARGNLSVRILSILSANQQSAGHREQRNENNSSTRTIRFSTLRLSAAFPRGLVLGFTAQKFEHMWYQFHDSIQRLDRASGRAREIHN